MSLLEASVWAMWLLLLVLAVAVFALYRHFGQIYVGSARGRADQGPTVGAALPPASLTDLAGAPLQLPGRRPVVLVFGDTACDLCAEVRAELPALAGHREAISTVLLCDGSAAEVADWSAQAPDFVRVVHDAKGALAHKYKVNTLPFAVCVGLGGVVVAKSIINGREGLEWAAEQALRLPATSPTASEPVRAVSQ
jgi:hypothetical protein